MVKVVVLVWMLAIVANCSDAGAPEPLSLEDYIALGCGAPSSPPSPASWEEYTEHYQTHIDRFEDIRPPEALEAFHQALMALLRAEQEIAKGKDPSAPWETYEHDTPWPQVLAVDQAFNDLDDDVIARFADC